MTRFRGTLSAVLALCYILESTVAIGIGCDKAAVDECLQGILFSAENNRTFFWKDVAAVENLCSGIQALPECVQKATEGCPEGAKRFLKALMKGYEVVQQSPICSPGADGVKQREMFANQSRCLRDNFDNDCMLSYVNALETLVKLDDKDKVRKACCLHRTYRVCLADKITPLCGVDAASGYIQLNSMLSAGPIREICGSAYVDDFCSDSGWNQTPISVNNRGTILSRLMQLLIELNEVPHPAHDQSLDEALEYTSCSSESIDECFIGLLPTTESNTTGLWSNESQLDSFCGRARTAPHCLKSRSPVCRTRTNEFLRLVKNELDMTDRASFCERGQAREFFIEAGRCVSENVSNNCTRTMILALQATLKVPSGSRGKLECCLTSKYAQCLNNEIKPVCGAPTADFYSALLRRMTLPGQSGCECELDVAEKEVFPGTAMRTLVLMTEGV